MPGRGETGALGDAARAQDIRERRILGHLRKIEALAREMVGYAVERGVAMTRQEQRVLIVAARRRQEPQDFVRIAAHRQQPHELPVRPDADQLRPQSRRSGFDEHAVPSGMQERIARSCMP